MKIKILLLTIIMSFGQMAYAVEESECDTDKIQRAPNLIVEILTIPFKAIAALTYGPRCLLDSIPKNEE